MKFIYHFLLKTFKLYLHQTSLSGLWLILKKIKIHFPYIKDNYNNYIKRNNLDMIQFNSVFEINDNKTEINRRFYKYTCIIYQPIISHIYY